MTEGAGNQSIVTMREKTSQILQSHFSKQEDEESQKWSIIQTTARLIKCEIKSDVPSITDKYLSTKSLELETVLSFVPETLRTLLYDFLSVSIQAERLQQFYKQLYRQHVHVL